MSAEIFSEIESQRDKCAVDGCVVLRLLALCLTSGTKPPQWLSDAYIARHAKVTSAQLPSWDAAFGRPWPKGTRLQQVRNKTRLQEAVHSAAWALAIAQPTRPLDDAFFHLVGQSKGIFKSAGQTKGIYYEAVKSGAASIALVRRRKQRALKSGQASSLTRIDSLLHSTPATSL